MRLLLFGSSARRGATGWTDAAAVRTFLETVRPSVVGHGASPSGGADALVDSVARELGLTVEPCPVDTEQDGPWPAAGMRRNGRMLVTLQPQLGGGFVSGRVGQRVGTRGCYLSNGSQDMADRLARAEVPVVIFREDGIEPDPTPLRTMRLLRGLVGDGLEVPYQVVNAWRKGEARVDEVALVLLCAMDGSRVEPWLRAVREAVRVRRAA